MPPPLNKTPSISTYFSKVRVRPSSSPPPPKRARLHSSAMTVTDPADIPSIAETHKEGESTEYKPRADLNKRISIWRGELSGSWPKLTFRRHHQAQGTLETGTGLTTGGHDRQRGQQESDGRRRRGRRDSPYSGQRSIEGVLYTWRRGNGRDEGHEGVQRECERPDCGSGATVFSLAALELS